MQGCIWMCLLCCPNSWVMRMSNGVEMCGYSHFSAVPLVSGSSLSLLQFGPWPSITFGDMPYNLCLQQQAWKNWLPDSNAELYIETTHRWKNIVLPLWTCNVFHVKYPSKTGQPTKGNQSFAQDQILNALSAGLLRRWL